MHSKFGSVQGPVVHVPGAEPSVQLGSTGWHMHLPVDARGPMQVVFGGHEPPHDPEASGSDPSHPGGGGGAQVQIFFVPVEISWQICPVGQSVALH